MAARVTRCVLGRVGFGWSWLGRGGEGDGAGAAGPERAQHTLTPAGLGMSPANRVSSARSRLATTITAHVSVHAGQHRPTTCRRRPNRAADRATITGQTERPIWARALRRRCCDDADEPSQGTPVL